MDDILLMASDGLLETIGETVTRMRADYGKLLLMVHEANRRGVAQALGHKDLPEVLKYALRLDRRESRELIAQASVVARDITPTGSVLPPTRPWMAEALAEGELSPTHVEVITKAMAHLPDAAEEILVTAARSAEPQAIKHLAVEIQRRVDQDGPEPSDEELRQPRNILRTRIKRNGRLEFHGDLDPEAGATLEMLLSPLTKPHPEGPDGPDERTLAERQGDAFVELLDLAHRSDGLPSEAGEPLHLYAVVDFERMRDQVGYATLGDTVDVTARALRRMACTASIIPVVMDTEGQVLDIGRQSRKLTVHMRRALHLRDRGCAFPHCNRPPRHCDGHHAREWINGGETKVDNLLLLCRRHHRLIHHSQWEVAIVNGIPLFYPPAFVDPQRRPLRNFLHTGAS